MQIHEDPRDLWLKDIGDFTKERLEKGEQIILMADFNEDVTNTRMRTWARNIGLTEVLSQAYGKVPTRQQGRLPIDGIYVSNTINITRMGYAAFGLFDSDHRCLWIDVPTQNIYGFKLQRIAPPIT